MLFRNQFLATKWNGY